MSRRRIDRRLGFSSWPVAFWSSLALAHAGLGGLLGVRLVGEDSDPAFPAALDGARHRDARRLDLPRGDPAGLQDLEARVAERQRRAARGLPPHAAPLLL